MSPHPRYNSRVLAFLARRFVAIRDRTQEVVRHTKMVSRWTAEVFLYPFAQLRQTQRILGQKVQQGVEKIVGALTSAREHRSVLKANDSSAPILKILDEIELLQPVQSSNDLSNPNPPQAAAINFPQRVKLTWVKKVVSAIQTAQGWLQPASPPAQQTLTALSHPLSDSRRWPNVLTTWIDKRVGAIESMQRGGLQSSSQVSVVSAKSTLPTQIPRRHPQKFLGGWVNAGIMAFRKVTRFLMPSAGSQSIDTPSGLTHHAQLVTSRNTSMPIQGIASLLETQSLVLVTPEQEILDILTPAQQTHLYQRMMQELSKAHRLPRRNRVFGNMSQFLKRLSLAVLPQAIRRLPGRGQAIAHQLLPHAHQFSPKLDKLKKWVFRSVIGALATLPMVAIPALAEENLPKPYPQSNQAISALWVDPSHLKTPVALEELYGMVSGLAQGQQRLRTYPKSNQSSSLRTTDLENIAQGSFSPKDYHTEILIDAEFLGYEPHLLERILAWLDLLMVQFELGLSMVWSGVGILVLLCLSSIQKLQQWIWD